MATKAMKPSELIARASERLRDKGKLAPMHQVGVMSKAEVQSKNYDAALVTTYPNLSGHCIKGHIHYRVRGKHSRLRGPSAHGPVPTKTFYQNQ